MLLGTMTGAAELNQPVKTRVYDANEIEQNIGRHLDTTKQHNEIGIPSNLPELCKPCICCVRQVQVMQ